MSRLIKIVDNKYVQIEEYRNPNNCFNTNEYNDFEDYCTLREIFNPFEMFYENKKLKEQLQKQKEVNNKAIKYINKYENIKAYYEYIDEDGYEEYNYNEDFKKELLHILESDNNQ